MTVMERPKLAQEKRGNKCTEYAVNYFVSAADQKTTFAFFVCFLVRHGAQRTLLESFLRGRPFSA